MVTSWYYYVGFDDGWLVGWLVLYVECWASEGMMAVL
jgi:hypothetical protein